MPQQSLTDQSHIWDNQVSQHPPPWSFHPGQFKRNAFIRPVHTILGPFDYDSQDHNDNDDQDGLTDDDVHGIGEPQDTAAARPNQLLSLLESNESQLEEPKELPAALVSPVKAVPSLDDKEVAMETNED